MTQDQYEIGTLEDAKKFAIIRMAREAGIPIETDWAGRPSTLVINDSGVSLRGVDDLERFAALVAAHEREKLEDAYPACIPYTDEELEEAKSSLLKAKSLDERFAFIWETIYDHGNGKHLGALSRAQREVAWFYLQQIQDVCKAIESAVLAEREACAKVCEKSSYSDEGDYFLEQRAAAIRARGQHE